MYKKLGLTLTILFLFMSLGQAMPLSASDRVNNLANEESTWRWIGGGAKVIAGAALTGVGYSLISFRGNDYVAAMLIPLGIIAMVPGVITLGWGGYDFFFGSREYENQYEKLKLISGETTREDQALQYLKDKAAKDKQVRQPSFWNAFGLFSMCVSPSEREYNGYLKDRTQ